MSHVSRQIVVVDPLFGIRHKLQQRGGGSMLEFRQFERSHLSGSWNRATSLGIFFFVVLQDSRTTSQHVNINMFDLLHPPFCIALGIRGGARGSKVWQDLRIKEDFFTPCVHIHNRVFPFESFIKHLNCLNSRIWPGIFRTFQDLGGQICTKIFPELLDGVTGSKVGSQLSSRKNL